MSIAQTLNTILSKTRAKKKGNGWEGHCPSHNDKRPSFTIDQKADGTILLRCHKGPTPCDIDSICSALGITQADLFPAPPPKQTATNTNKPQYILDKTYDYKDETGNLLFQCVRKKLKDPTKWPNEPLKQFLQRAPNGTGWVWSLKNVRRVLYRLPELLTSASAGATAFIVEGEKDAERLIAEGLTATCNPMGAGKWLDEYSDFLAGREVVIIPDNDDAGKDHAQTVAASLYGKAKKIQILELNGLALKGDVSDWLDAGGDETTLCQMADAALEWSPPGGSNAGASNNQNQEWEAPVPFFVFDLPDFPLQTFPAWLRSFVEGLALATQTPPDLAALLSLGVCGASCARVVRVEIRKGWQEPLNIYLIIALPPANRKSQVFSEVTHPLFDYERKLILDKRDEIAEAQSEYRTLVAELTELEKKAARTEPPDRDKINQERKAKARELAARKEPVLPKLISDDVTPEVVPTILSQQQGRLGIFSAEGGLVGTVGGRYSNGVANIDVLLKGHSGDDLRVDRRDRSEHIEKPALTIGLAVQPNILRALAEKPEFKERGLTARFLYSIPRSTIGSRKIRPEAMTDEARKTYSDNIKRLAAIQPYIDSDAETIPRMIKLSKDADDYLAKFEEEIEPQLGLDGDLHSIADWGGKLAGATARIASILHLAQHADNFNLNGKWPHEVSSETLKNAIEISRYLIAHAQAAYAEMGADAKIEDAKYVLRWIEKGGLTKFTKREAYQATKGRFKQVTALEPALKTLEDHGFIRLEDNQASNRPGRRPSEKYEVNPLMLRL